MKKPENDTFTEFADKFAKASERAGKEQYLIPYFIAAHPGTTDEDMLELALWLKSNDFRADQVQAFLPGPMATATAMYHSGVSPLRRVSAASEPLYIPKGARQRRVHKAFLRYHDPANWPILRQALTDMGRADLIGSGKGQLVPAEPRDPGRSGRGSPRKGQGARPFRTQHTRPGRKRK